MIREQHQYRQIYAELKQQIHTLTYKTGDLLPSENELCRQYGTNRGTVRQALQELRQEGYILKRRGKGSIVASQCKALGLLTFKGFSEVVRGAQHAVRTVQLHPLIPVPWPENFFYPLAEAELENGCLYLERLRLADDEPVMLEFTYLPNQSPLERLTEEPLTDGSLFRTLASRLGIEVLQMEQFLRAVAANQQVAAAFNIAENTPVVHIFRRYETNYPMLFLYSLLYCHTGTFALSDHFT